MLSLPIRKNRRPWREDCPAARAGSETLRAKRHNGRAFRTRWTGYHAGSRIEAKMRCLKAFGERFAARDHDRQTAEIQTGEIQAGEIQIRAAPMNRFNALGTAKSFAWHQVHGEREATPQAGDAQQCFLEGATGVFADAPKADPEPIIEAKTPHVGLRS